MQKILSAAAAAAALIACAHAQAQDTRYYAGVTTGSSKASLTNSAGERYTSTNHPIPLKVYGGVELTRHFAIEAGYAGATGKHEFDQGLTGQGAPEFSSQVAYAAVKATMPLSESFDVFGKAGAAYSRYEMEGAGPGNFKFSGAKPMGGVGVAYKVSDRFALTLELEHYGKVKEEGASITQNRIHAGVKFGF